MGSGAMARAYAECLGRHTTGARLVVIGGGTRAAALAQDYGVEIAPNASAVANWQGVDAVIIATPETSHAELAMTAAQHGRHALVEKPLAPTAAVGERIVAAAEMAGMKLMVVKHWRFRGVHTRALQLLASGELGSVHRVENTTRVSLTSSLANVARKPFYLDPAGGGLLMGWAVHNLDWVCHVLGAEPTVVRPLAATQRHVELGPTRLEIELEFGGRSCAIVRVIIDEPESLPPDLVFHTCVVCANGELDLNGYGDLRVRRESGPWRTCWQQPGFDPADALDAVRLEAYAAMLQAFIDAVRTDSAPPVSGRDGQRAVRLFELSLKAMQQRGEIAL